VSLLDRLSQDERELVRGPTDQQWASPDLVCQVAFTEWTPEGRLRHPRYLGLRRNTDPGDVVREEPRSPA
jgi:ATP-dependent DNA ligase